MESKGDARRYRLFAYGTFLEGEPDHELLGESPCLGPAETKPGFQLVEAGPAAGLLEGGYQTVVGDLYELDVQALARCDLKREHPVLYQRKPIELADGSEAYAYFLSLDQTRGRRRIRHGDWRNRFKAKRPDAGPYVRWARDRHRGD